MLLGRDGPKSRAGESFTGGFPQEVRKRLLLVGNQGDNDIENGVFRAVSVFCFADTRAGGDPRGEAELGRNTKPHQAQLSRALHLGKGREKAQVHQNPENTAAGASSSLDLSFWVREGA